MKLRIRGNSLRLRLGQGEVRRLADGGAVEERTDFAANGPALVYALRTADADATSATFDGGRITVTVPRAVAQEWASTAQVGIEASQPAGNGDVLRILIEKDFECLDAPAGEPQSDAFPNPRGGKC